MPRESSRLNVTLDPERAVKLALLAKRTNTQEEALARSLLSHAIDEADVDARHVIELLDGIPGALERAQLGLEQARSGETIRVDKLLLVTRSSSQRRGSRTSSG